MRATASVGLAAVLFGFVVVFERGLAGLFGSMSYVFVTLVGVLALVQGLRILNDARRVEARAAETADVEDRYEVPFPGEDIDVLLASGGGLSTVSVKRRRELHARLDRAARETLRARGDYDEAELPAALREGTWTDDPVAAWFLGDDRPAPAAVRLRGLLGSDVEFRFAAARTVEALAAARSGEVPEDASDDGSPSGAGGGLGSTIRAAGRRRLRSVRDRLPGVGR
ncbi:DUF7269 family protein [Halorarum salinum]|uniref:Uncharacterized protein n=1 Tax=Halorarum salinum TaxID=2743089 RepID=A0A7D5LDM9_9EURY|nr:hypothetical protein [Halobaculum salinum]QLG63867.1 hypothetical protein HUG12_19935 [Halobaculum salinum]